MRGSGAKKDKKMNEQEKLSTQLDLLLTLIEKSKEYGSKDQPLTLSIFRGILRETLQEITVKMLNL